MTTGTEVKKAIEGAMEDAFTAASTIGDVLSRLRYTLSQLDSVWANGGDEDALEFVCEVAAICVAGAEQLCVVIDDETLKEVSITREQILGDIVRACDTTDPQFLKLIEYGTLADFITEMNKLFLFAQAAAHPAYADNALNKVKWVSAVAFAAMVKFGVPAKKEVWF